MDIKTFGIVGAGQMGNGIAQVAAMSGLEVIMSDIAAELVERGLETIKKNLQRGVEKGKMTVETMDGVLGRITASVDIKDMASADFVVEAATEHEPIKFQIFEDLDRICASHVILATNTSSIPIGRVAACTKRPDKIIGMHFMNPVPVMKLVEVIRGLATSDDTFKTTLDLAVRFGKTPAEANDYPGFIANRILMPMINEAVYCLYQDVGSREDIDTVMKLGANHPTSAWIPVLQLWKPFSMDLKIQNTAPVRCFGNMWRPAGWAERRVGDSMNTHKEALWLRRKPRLWPRSERR